MSPWFFACLVLGALLVFQPTINRFVFEAHGIAKGLFINGVIIFILANILLFFTYWQKDLLPTMFYVGTSSHFRWWHVLPGLFGFTVVLFIPLMIKQLGAFATIVSMLAGQAITSFIWDLLVEGQPFSFSRSLGLVLAIFGAYLSFRP